MWGCGGWGLCDASSESWRKVFGILLLSLAFCCLAFCSRRSTLNYMANVDGLILEHLRAIRTDIGSIKDDVRELKLRVGNLDVIVEVGAAGRQHSPVCGKRAGFRGP